VSSRLWLIPLVGAVLATLVTWLPMIAYPGWVVPPYAPREGIDLWAQQALWFTLFTVVAMLVGQRDTFLGLAVFMMGAGYFLWGGTLTTPHRLMFMGGALGLWAMRQIPRSHTRFAVNLLAVSGAFQALYIVGQRYHFDPLWGQWVGGMLMPNLRALGTLGTEDAAAANVAITAPLMPWWLLPLPFMAVVVGQPEGHSLTAIGALLVGLAVRYYRTWWLLWIEVWSVLLAALWGFQYVQHWQVPSTALARLAVWALALRDWWATFPIYGFLPNIHPQIFYATANPVTGNGPWWPRVALLQKYANVLPTNESFQQAHNDWLQWGYEYGLLGVGILGGWLWTHRRMVTAEHGVGAALIAGAVAAGGFFIFQVVGLALLMIALVGIATRVETPQEVA